MVVRYCVPPNGRSDGLAGDRFSRLGVLGREDCGRVRRWCVSLMANHTNVMRKRAEYRATLGWIFVFWRVVLSCAWALVR
jgi:hypothetical protein